MLITKLKSIKIVKKLRTPKYILKDIYGSGEKSDV